MQSTSWGERATEPTHPTPTDGRTARRDRNRTAVLDAVIELFDEDDLSPGVHEVARRSGVSLRSVYRYFDDVDALIAAAIERQYELSRPHFTIPRLGQGPLDERIGRFCRARVELFVRVRTVFVAATVRARLDRQVAEGLDWSRKQLRRQTEAMFAPELDALDEADRQMTFVTLDVLSQFETLELLRETRGFGEQATIDYLVDTFTDRLA